jgi:protein-S-isoprenylcysteine O-methyltransferase Ste14
LRQLGRGSFDGRALPPLQSHPEVYTGMTILYESIALGFIWLAFWFYWVASAVIARRHARALGASESNIARLIHVAVVIVAVFLMFAGFDTTSSWGRIIPVNLFIECGGMLLTLLFLSLAMWARQILGNNWSGKIRKVEGQRLITAGPYKLVRNPIYTGIVGGFLGSFIMIGTVSALVGFLVILAAYLVKIKREEKFLFIEFGDSYRQYMKHSWALIPYIY